MATLANISQQISIYVGTVLFFGGIIGSLLNIIVFLSLRTFRENACAFYFTVMSFVNIGNLITGLSSRIIISGFGIDWTLISPFYCKLRWYCLQLCVLTSFTCTCLAAIDQYMATNSRARWRKWSNIKIAHRLSAIFIVIWLLHGIPYIVYFNLNQSPTTGKVSCSSGNPIFQRYHVYGYLIALAGGIPLIINIIFGLLAYNNVQHLAHRTVPLVRRHLDKQLTMLVLVQIFHNFVTTSPYTCLTLFASLPTYITDPVITARLDFTNIMVILLYYLSFTSPFYIFVCASERFRQQLIYVLFNVHLKRWRRPQILINQVVPST